jgi:hypothetical protein
MVYLNIANNDLGQGLGKLLSVYLEKTSLLDLNISANKLSDKGCN